MLEVALLGHLRLTQDGHALHGVRNPRLLAYLLLNRGRPRTRQQVAFTLWPESGDAQALTNLRRELHNLRRALPELDGLIDTQGGILRWQADGPFRLDVAQFENAVERGRSGDIDALREAIATYIGDLAPSIYDDWIAPDRDRLRNLQLETIRMLAARVEEQREYRDAMALLQRVIELDPLDESTYRAVMRVAVLAGDRSAALRAYHACSTVLQAELGIMPSQETRIVYEQLASGETGRSDTAPSGPSATIHRLIGRTGEWAALTGFWRRGQSGRPTLALVTGEAGIGKSRLIEELVRWTRARGFAAAYARSYAAEGALAYAPIVVWLRAEPIRGALTRLDDPWLVEIARLLPELVSERESLRSPEPMTASWQRQRLFEALVRAVRATNSPLLLVLDDAHWADQDTLEWLHYVLRADPPLPLVAVVASRSEDLTMNAALSSLLLDARERGELQEIDLQPLSEAETIELATDVADRALSDDERSVVFSATEGHPLVVVELARGGLPSLGSEGAPAARTGAVGQPAGPSPMPPRIRAVIAHRLEQLSPEARQVVRVAATFGRGFEFDALARASNLGETSFVRALDELWQRRIVRDGGPGLYDFNHDRIREVAYGQISPVERRLLHRHVARALELTHADDLDPLAGELAAHYEAAGQPARAIDLLERAADVASRVSADAEVVANLSQAIALLRQQPKGRDRDVRELGLLFNLTPALLSVDGYASARQEQTMERATDLAEAVGNRRDVMRALNGLWSVRIVGGDIRRSVELAEMQAARAAGDPEFTSTGHMAVAGSAILLGQIDRAVDEFRMARATHRPGRSMTQTMGADAGIFAATWLSHALWLQGAASEASHWSAVAIEAAADVEAPLMRVIAQSYAAILAQWRGDTESMAQRTATVAELCHRYGFAYYDQWVAILEAWASGASRPGNAERIEHAIDRMGTMRALIRRPFYYSLLADVHVANGRIDAGRAVLRAALADARAREETWWIPEIRRRIGEIELGEVAEHELLAAIDLARRQGSHALALRSAISLAQRVAGTDSLLASVLAGVPDAEEGDRAAAETLLRRTESVP